MLPLKSNAPSQSQSLAESETSELKIAIAPRAGASDDHVLQCFDMWRSFCCDKAEMQVNLSSGTMCELQKFFALRLNLSGSLGSSPPSPTNGKMLSDAQASDAATWEQFQQWCRVQSPQLLLDAMFAVFDAAQREIYCLMEADSFKRFKRSPAFQSLSDEIASGPGLSKRVSAVSRHSSP